MSPSVPKLLICFAAGLLAGLGYFFSLWWSTRRFAQGGGAAGMLLAMLARILLLGGVLALVAIRGGTLPLLLAALGVFAGRALVLRWRGREAS